MVPRQKFNPRTGKFEPVTSTPTTTPPMGGFMGGLSGNATTTTAAPKKTTAKAGTTTTTTPKKPSPTTTIPRRNTQVAPQGPTATGPIGTVTPTAPAKPVVTVTGAEMQAMIAQILANGGGITEVQAAIDALNGGDGGGLTEAQKLEQQRVKNADSYRAGMGAADIQAQAGVDAQTQYGALAKTAYDTAKTAADSIYNPAVGDTNTYYDTQVGNLQKYVDAQRTAATGTIDASTADLLAGLKGTTAYQDASVANVAAPTQGLGDMLKSYGGTGQSAQEQQNMDAASAKQISEMFGRSNKQLAGAETDYYTGLQNAAKGAQAAGKANLASVLATIQAQDKSGIETNRRSELAGLQATRAASQGTATDLQNQLLAKGIDSLMSGKQAAATTRAQTTASYGVPKPKAKAKPKPKPKK